MKSAAVFSLSRCVSSRPVWAVVIGGPKPKLMRRTLLGWREGKGRPGTVVLVLGEADCIRFSLAGPALGERGLLAALRVNLGVWSPLPPERAMLGVLRHSNSRATCVATSIEQVSRSVSDQASWRSALKLPHANVSYVSAMSLLDAADDFTPLQPAPTLRPNSPWRPLKWIGAFAAAAAALVAIAIAAEPYFAAERRIDLLQRKHDALRPAINRAVFLRNEVNRLKNLRATRLTSDDEHSTFQVIETLANAVPDSAFLTQIRIEDGKVTVAGKARDTAAVIARLHKVKIFASAQFSDRIVRSDDGRQNFQIEIELAPPAAVEPGG